MILNILYIDIIYTVILGQISELIDDCNENENLKLMVPFSPTRKKN